MATFRWAGGGVWWSEAVARKRVAPLRASLAGSRGVLASAKRDGFSSRNFPAMRVRLHGMSQSDVRFCPNGESA
ncbi:MAG: hypothetical protein QGH20_02290 [Candidatus Latescibacteria bacterium]|nr:hypothetical protein [Candidatus Latescibacterota bacterium]